MYGHASPQPIVTTTSACSASSVVSGCGRRSERSMPSSRMTCTTSGCTCPPRSASLPAESARWCPRAARSNSAALICERPALCKQTNRTVAISERPRVQGRCRTIAHAPSSPHRQHVAGLFAQALARLAEHERVHEGAHRRVVEARQQRISAGADVLRAVAGLELLCQLRQQPRQAQLVGGAVRADGIELGLDELAYVKFDAVPDGAYILERAPCGVRDAPDRKSTRLHS